MVALKHTVQPRIAYEWIEHVDQEGNPFFTIEDRLQGKNDLIVRLDNILTAKYSSVVRQKDGIGNNYSYRDFINLSVSTGFDFKEDSREKHVEVYERRPWHDLRTRLDFKPLKWINFHGDAYYSFYDGKLNRVDVGSTLFHNTYGSFRTSYSQREPNYNYRRFVNYDNVNDIVPSGKINVITNTLSLKASPELSLYIMERTNLDTGKSYERVAGVGYKHQCLYLYGEYTKDQIEERFSLNIEFLGLGF